MGEKNSSRWKRREGENRKCEQSTSVSWVLFTGHIAWYLWYPVLAKSLCTLKKLMVLQQSPEPNKILLYFTCTIGIHMFRAVWWYWTPRPRHRPPTRILHLPIPATVDRPGRDSSISPWIRLQMALSSSSLWNMYLRITASHKYVRIFIHTTNCIFWHYINVFLSTLPYTLKD
jgi:hypothetical protein